MFRRLIGRVVFSTAIVLFASLLADRAAGLIMAPIPPPQVTHPPNSRGPRETIEFTYEFRTNSLGLRDRERPLARQSPRERRLVLGGDSFTEGYGVADDDRFSNLLEARLSTADEPATVVNAAMSGLGPDGYGRALLVAGMRYDPELAIIVVYANDLHDTPAGAALGVGMSDHGEFFVLPERAPWEPGTPLRRLARRVWPWAYTRLQYLSRSWDERRRGGLGFREFLRERADMEGIGQDELAAWLAALPAEWVDAAEEGRLNGSRLAHGLFVPDVLVQSLDVEGAEAEAKWAAVDRILTELVARMRVRGTACAVVYAPDAAQYDASALELYRTAGVTLRTRWLTEASEFERRLAAWAARDNVPFMSLTPGFRAAAATRPGAFNFPLDGHWNREGHAVAADAIADWIVDEELLSRRR